MRRFVAILSITIGAVLLLPVLDSVWGQPSELKPAALQPLISIPLKEIYGSRSLSVRLVLPSDEDIGAGDLNRHRYMVMAAASKQVAHCWHRVGIIVSGEIKGERLAMQDVEGVPYGWSARCPQAGVLFSAGPMEQIELHLATDSALDVSGDLVVIPLIRGVKDRLVGQMIHRDLVRISWFTTPVGLLLIAIGIASFRFRYAGR